MRYTSPTRQKSVGFTLIEMLIIAPIVVLTIGAFVGVMISVVGNVLVARDQSSISFDTQNALDRIEQDTRLSTQFLLTTNGLTAPQGSDSNFTGAAAFTNTSTLILSGLATDKNPSDTSRWLVYRANQPNPCGSNERYNRPFLTKIVYFIKSGSLWRRVILPDYNTNSAATADNDTLCTTPWQKNTCSPGYSMATRCQTNDEEIMKNIDSLVVSYYSNPASTTDLGASGALSATTIGVTINAKKTTAGRDVTFGGTMRASKLNSIDTTQLPPAAPVITDTLATPNTVEFSWPAVSDATAYQVGYRINGGEWVSQTLTASTTKFAVTGDRTDVISFRASSFNAAGLSAYGTDSATLPAWSTFTLQNNWQDYGSGYTAHAFTKSKESIVVLRGLIRSGTTTWGTTIGMLPEGYRPGQRLILYTNSYAAGANAMDSGVGRIDILPTGEILFMEGTNGWASLDGITFVASSAPYTWTNLSYQNGWTYFGSPWAVTRVTKDTSTRVHLEGLAQQGTTAWGTAIAGLPPNHAPSLHQLFPTNGNARTFNAFGAYNTNAVTALGFNNSYLSLDVMYYPASYAGWTNLSLQNSWVNFDGGYATAQYTKSSDGIVTLKGLIKSGNTTNGTVLATLPAGYRPSATQIFGSVANNAYGRVDILSNGQILFRVGSSSWTSFDGISFMADQ